MRRFAEWLLPRYAADDLPRALRRPLRRFVANALARDAALAAAYDALRASERAAATAPGLSAAQREALLLDVFATLEAQEPAGVAVDDDAPAATSSFALARVPFALAAACGAAFLFVAQPASDSPSYSSSLQPQAAAPLGDVATRGGAPDTSPVGVRVRCVDGDRVFDDAVAGARVRGDDLECSTVGLLAFSTTNLARADRYALVVGVDGDGRRVWLEPFAHGTPARVLSAGSIDVVVDRLVPMSVLPDDVTLHVLVSDRPFSSEEIERRLVAAERSAVPLAQLDRLPVDVSLQSHLSLHRVP